MARPARDRGLAHNRLVGEENKAGCNRNRGAPPATRRSHSSHIPCPLQQDIAAHIVDCAPECCLCFLPNRWAALRGDHGKLQASANEEVAVSRRTRQDVRRVVRVGQEKAIWNRNEGWLMGNKARLVADCLRQESVCVWGIF